MRSGARHLLLLLALALISALALLFALVSGSVEIGWSGLGRALAGGLPELERSVLLELRLPRAAAAFVTGALLALAGALMQALLRNPLADPYILGVSGGAAVGAMLVMVAGLGGVWLSGAAFAGALGSMALVFGLAHGRGGWTPTRLLLTGVVVAAGWGALVSFILSIAPEGRLHGMLFWLMGDLGYAVSPLPAAVALAVGLGVALMLARDLNVLVRGELLAGALGVGVDGLRRLLYLLASLLTASAVTLAGSVGFVGLVVPHLLRLLGAHDHRVLLPAAALLGGALLTAADTLARTVLAPTQLPVGVLTAMVGVPVFLLLLHRAGRPREVRA